MWIPLFGWQLNPMFGAAAMSLSSFCVVTNALRLNLFRMYDVGKDRRIKNAVTGQTAAAAAKEPDDPRANVPIEMLNKSKKGE